MNHEKTLRNRIYDPNTFTTVPIYFSLFRDYDVSLLSVYVVLVVPWSDGVIVVLACQSVWYPL